MSTESDTLRDLAGKWELLEADNRNLQEHLSEVAMENARLADENDTLKAKLAALQPKPNFLFQDDFTGMPVSGPTSYAIDAPLDALLTAPGGLSVKYNYDSPRNQNGKAKAELGPRLGEKLERYARIPFLLWRWHAVTITVPQEWEDDSNKVSVLDFHGTEDPGEEGIGRNASLSLMIWNKGFVGWRLWSDKPIQTKNEHRDTIFSTSFVRDLPYRFIYRTVFDWHRTGAGETDVWIVRGAEPVSLLYSERGPNAYNDKEGPYFKLGIYVPSWNIPNAGAFKATKKRLLFSRLRIANAGARLEDLL